MKITYTEWVERINTQLQKYNQLLRAEEMKKGRLKFTNNVILVNNELTRFKKRLFSEKTTVWASNMDNLFNGAISEAEIKSKLASIGGLVCQQKHGNRIKDNLNTGSPWNKGLKGKYPYKFGPRPSEVKDKIGAKNSGPNNGMYGRKMSADEKSARSDLMKQKILSGEFTPNTNNRNTHWGASYNGKKYRSSWEALYQYINPAAEYETLRIEYALNGKKYIYIVDFVDHVSKQAIEVKPRELCCGNKFVAKMSALSSWAKQHNYSIVLVDQHWLHASLVDEVDYSQFDDKTISKIRKLYEAKKKNRN